MPNELTPENGFFSVTAVHRGDFDDIGYDASSLTDDQMRKVAGWIEEHLMESGVYWEILRDFAREAGLPMKKEEVEEE